MIQRFTIEDLVAQNEWGVVYHAVDTKTGLTVGIRRFFPFGHDGGGLDSEEQIAYAIAVERLTGIRHPAMRSIVWGGCDPVDQMPCIVTEWIKGLSLQSYTENGPLKQEDAIQILVHALEVCELLSELFAEEAVWIETDLESIIVGDEGTGRGATFWISPLRWLGSGHHMRGMDAIVQLTEEIMHWRGLAITDEAAGGLGAWLKWLRQESANTSLQQAREKLSAAIGVKPPPSAKVLVKAATVSDGNLEAGLKKGLSPITWVIIALILSVAIGVAWWLTQQGAPGAGAWLDRTQAASIR